MIREITRSDFERFWPCFESVIKAQETYAFDPTMTGDDMWRRWKGQMPVIYNKGFA
jgi:hypothetical protein